MLVYTKRCRHCNSSYQYQASGGGCDRDTNDDRYCPECMTAINTALARIDVKCHPEFLPVLPTLPFAAATVEEFDRELAKKKAEDTLNPYHLNVRRVSYGTPGVIEEDLEIRGVNYRKLVDTVTGEVLLTAQYEVSGPITQNERVVTGLW